MSATVAISGWALSKIKRIGEIPQTIASRGFLGLFRETKYVDRVFYTKAGVKFDYRPPERERRDELNQVDDSFALSFFLTKTSADTYTFSAAVNNKTLAWIEFEIDTTNGTSPTAEPFLAPTVEPAVAPGIAPIEPAPLVSGPSAPTMEPAYALATHFLSLH